MTDTLLQILILVIVVGGILYVLGILPIDNTIKAIGRVVIIIVAAVYAITLLAGMVNAQPVPDILDRIIRRTDNPTLTCNVYRNLDRDGDIRYLRMDCRADSRWRRDRR